MTPFLNNVILDIVCLFTKGELYVCKIYKRKKSTKRRPNKAKENTALKEEIWILLSLAVCILMVISNFGIGGMVGEAASSVMFGLFGYMAYVLPFLLFAGIALVC